MGNTVTVIDIVAQVTDKTGAGAAGAISSVTKLEQAMRKAQAEIDKIRKMSKLEVTMYAIDKASKVLDGIWNTGKRIGGTVWNVTLKAIDLVTAPFRGIMRLISDPIVAMAGMAGISLGVADLFNTYKDFEQSMANVGAITRGTQSDMASLSATAKKLGEETMFSAQQVADGMQFLAMAGWKTERIISGMPGLLDLAAAGGVDVATAADVTSSALAQFKMGADEAARVADVLAATATNSKTDVRGLGESLKFAGTAAGSMGYRIEDVALALGLMGDVGLDGSMAGTAARSIVARMSGKDEAEIMGEGDKISAAMKKLGVSMYDATGKTKPFVDVLRDLRTGFAEVRSEGGNVQSLAQDIAGMYAKAGLLAIADASEEKFNQMASAIENSKGVAREMALVRMDTLQGSLYYLQSAVEGVKIAFMDELAPHLKSFLDWVTSKVPGVKNVTVDFADYLSGSIDGVSKSIDSMINEPQWSRLETVWDKVKFSWNKIIVQPFAAWWSSEGKAWFSGVALEAGDGIGSFLTGISSAILGLGDIGGEGLSVGQAFTDGFVKGLDQEKFTQALGKVFETALKLVFSNPITGGLAAAWIGSRVLGAVSSIYNLSSGIGGFLRGRMSQGAAIAGAAQTGGAATQSALAFAQNGALGLGAQLGARANGISQGANIANTVAQTGGTAARSALVFAQNGALGFGAQVGAGAAGFGMRLGRFSQGSALARAAQSSGSAAQSALVFAQNGALGVGTQMGARVTGLGMKTTAGLGAIGKAMGSGAATTGGLAAAGAAGLIGGAVGSAALIKGSLDLYKGFTAKDKDERAARSASGGLAIAGVGAGAAIGTLILPGLGTAIGAGIGGTIGWLGGNKVMEKYENDRILREQAEALRAEQALYSNVQLKEALADPSMTAEKFAAKFNAVVKRGLSSHFGEIKLSAPDVKNLSNKLIFKDSVASAERFSNAVSTAELRLGDLQTAMTELDRQNWFVGLGVKIGDSEKDSYKLSIDSFIEKAKEYVKERHFETSAAVSLFFEDSELTASINAMYASFQESIDGLSSELDSTIYIALNDGVITLDEQAEILNLQSQISAITSKVAQAETEASLDMLKIKYGGSKLDYDSFSALQADLEKQVASGTEMYETALKYNITNLHLMLAEGAITTDEFDQQLQKFSGEYHAKINEIAIDVESFQLDAIAESYGTELDKALPAFEGSTTDKLRSAFHRGLLNMKDVDPLEWEPDTVAEKMGLKGLSKEMEGQLTTLLGAVAKSLPAGFVISTGEELNASSPLLKPGCDALGNAARQYVSDAITQPLDAEMPINITAKYKLTNPGPPSFMLQNPVSFNAYNTVKPHALGGFMTRPHVGLVAEDGPEAIIPLSGKRRKRGLSIWEQAGRVLGVKPYAEGGVVGSGSGYAVFRSASDKADTEVRRDVAVSFGDINFNVDAGGASSPETIVQLVSERLGELSEQVQQRIADGVRRVFENEAVS